MNWRHLILFLVGLLYAVWHFAYRPLPALLENPILDLVAYHTPRFYFWMVWWYYLSPLVAVLLAGLILLAVWRVWFEARNRKLSPLGKLPKWPLKPGDPGPGIVVGEVHHPVAIRQISNPSWLTIPERGLYTGVAIFGAVGSGKTSACMHPFASQLLGWQAGNPHRRAAALVLEVKGDFCHDVRQILLDEGRGGDYMELSMSGGWRWNPLSAWWLDSYSLAYTVSSLLNQLFGKGKEPFWQQAYTNLVRWIIELHRVLPENWVTLQQVYYCAIDPEFFAEKIQAKRRRFLTAINTGTVEHPSQGGVWTTNSALLHKWAWTKNAVPKTKCGDGPLAPRCREKLDGIEVDLPGRLGAGSRGRIFGSGSRPSSAGTHMIGSSWTTKSNPRLSKACPCFSPCSICRTWPRFSVRPRRQTGPWGKPEKPRRSSKSADQPSKPRPVK